MTDETNAASSAKEDKKEPLEPVPATAAKDYVWTGPGGATINYTATAEMVPVREIGRAHV